MVFQVEKLSARVKELESYRYTKRQALEGWTIHEDVSKKEKYPPTVPPKDADKLVPNKLWEGRDRYFWLMGEVTVPEVPEADDFLLLFDFGKSSEGNTSGFEAQVYINGELYQAADGNHKEVFVDKRYANQTLQVALRLWGGLEGGGAAGEIWHHFKYADQAVLSTVTDDFYYTSLVMLETIELLGVNDPIRVKLLQLLDEAFLLLDWSKKGSEAFYISIKQANEQLQQALDDLEKQSDVTVTLVGHTHIDVAWLWRLKHTREKSARSFSTVLRLMEQYPEYIFLQTQPQVYEYIKEDYPELYEKIKEKVAEGRWEIDGAMWLESDANIPSGESLVRQILLGSRFMKEEFNQETKYLWLPDVFGYSWALPQILKKSGIDMFMTTKISWNQFNRMPNDTFYWKGIDGSEVLTHFITTPVPGMSEEFAQYTYNGLVNPYTVKGVYDAYRDKDLNQELLIAYGFGDGGGGVNREHLEKARRIQKLPGLPNVKTGKAGEYFEELKETFKKAKEAGKYVHTWDGELYLEYHRGTYTSQARNKMWNRLLELTYREAEFLHTWLLKTKGKLYPQETLTDGWKTILRNQFHDIIPGSSIKEVYEDSEIEYAKAKEWVDQTLEEIEQYTVKKEHTWTVFNSAAWERNEYVLLTGLLQESGSFEDEEGQVLESVLTDDGIVVYLENVPALGSKRITLVEGKPEEKASVFKVAESSVSTPFYKIEWNEKGHLASIFDKENQREVIPEGGSGNVFQLFEDKPMNWDAWDIDLFYQEKGKDLAVNHVEVVAENQLFAEIQFTYSFGQSSLSQSMVVYKDSRRIDFKTTVDWKERQQLLKVKFDVDVLTTEATYDIQYGNAKRPTHWNTSWDMAKFETVGHQWVDLSEQGYGVSLLNDSKYGHDIKDGTIRLSLLKGAIYPDPEADMGRHEFTYALYPHEGDFLESGTVTEAWSLNSPFYIVEGDFSEEPLFKVESDYPVMIDAVKKAEEDEGVIVRLHDYTGGRQKVTLRPRFEYASWQEVNLMEKEMDGCEAQEAKEIIELELKPYEVKTLYFK
jgi:alpha-mannosidase